MTARLVTQLGRRPYVDFQQGSKKGRGGGFPIHPGPVGGDRMLPLLWTFYGRPAGQLWQRVAERGAR